MVLITEEISKIINFVEEEFLLKQMGMCMMDIGKTMCLMEKDDSNLQMEIVLKVHTKMVKRRETNAVINGQSIPNLSSIGEDLIMIK